MTFHEKHKEKNWNKIPKDQKQPENITGRGLTFGEDSWRRFRKNKLAIFGVLLIGVIVLASVFGSFFTGYDYSTQDVYMRNLPPIIDITVLPDGTEVYVHNELKVYLLDESRAIVENLTATNQSLVDKVYSYNINGQEYFLKFGDGISFETADGTELLPTATAWNTVYLLGTDSLGRDMLTRLLYGGRISLIVAFITSAGILIIGLLYGGIAGYYGGTLDIIMMRIVEIISSIPNTIYIILLMVYLGQGIGNILIAMAITSWLDMARLVRGQVLLLKESEFVQAAKSIGVSPFNIIMRHLLPNCMGPIIISATLAIPGAIATEAFMSFIGLGVAPPMPSWGVLSSEGIASIRSAPYQILLPSIFISVTMFGFNFLGDGLRDALDPKLRQ